MKKVDSIEKPGYVPAGEYARLLGSMRTGWTTVSWPSKLFAEGSLRKALPVGCLR